MSRDRLIGGYDRAEGGSTDKCANKTEVHRVDIRTKVVTYIWAVLYRDRWVQGD